MALLAVVLIACSAPSPTPPAPTGSSAAAGNPTGQAFFTILQDAATRPTGGAPNSCFGRSWTIDVTASAISGSCDYRTAVGEYDQSWAWDLQKVGDPTKPPG